MLISFSLQNWMSFRDETEFSMKAGREKQHQERLASIPAYDLKLLPVSAVYGGNASGKSNFVKALEFCKELVCGDDFKPDISIPVSPFRLDKNISEPSCFSFTLLGDNDVVYEYTFSTSSECVLKETLVLSGTKPGDDVTIYRCVNDTFSFDGISPGEIERVTYLAEGTRRNQLFLTNSVSQRIKNEDLLAVPNWFSPRITSCSWTRIFSGVTKSGSRSVKVRDNPSCIPLPNSRMCGVTSRYAKVTSREEWAEFPIFHCMARLIHKESFSRFSSARASRICNQKSKKHEFKKAIR